MILVQKTILKFTWFISLFTSASTAIFFEFSAVSAELPSLFIPPFVYSYVTETAPPPFFPIEEHHKYLGARTISTLDLLYSTDMFFHVST